MSNRRRPSHSPGYCTRGRSACPRSWPRRRRSGTAAPRGPPGPPLAPRSAARPSPVGTRSGRRAPTVRGGKSPRGSRGRARSWHWWPQQRTPKSHGRQAPTAREGRRSAAHGPSAGTGCPPDTAAPGTSGPPSHNAGPRMAEGGVGGKKNKHGVGVGGKDGRKEKKEGERDRG